MRSFMLAALAVGFATMASAEPHFDGFIEGEASGHNITLFDVRIVGGEPGACVPGLTFTNLTTGVVGEFSLCCDDHFHVDGTWIELNWGLNSGVEFVSNDGDLDEISLRDCPNIPIHVQAGVWRATSEPGVFVREPLSTPVTATTWGQIKATFRR